MDSKRDCSQLLYLGCVLTQPESQEGPSAAPGGFKRHSVLSNGQAAASDSLPELPGARSGLSEMEFNGSRLEDGFLVTERDDSGCKAGRPTCAGLDQWLNFQPWSLTCKWEHQGRGEILGDSACNREGCAGFRGLL